MQLRPVFRRVSLSIEGFRSSLGPDLGLRLDLDLLIGSSRRVPARAQVRQLEERGARGRYGSAWLATVGMAIAPLSPSPSWADRRSERRAILTSYGSDDESVSLAMEDYCRDVECLKRLVWTFPVGGL